jgi:hypothetical protein
LEDFNATSVMGRDSSPMPKKKQVKKYDFPEAMYDPLIIGDL